MSINRITREDIIRLKLERKRQARKLSMIFSILAVTIVGVSLVVFYNLKDHKNVTNGKEMLVGVEPSLGSSDIDIIDYDTMISHSQTVEGVEEEEPDESDILDSFVFEVPETSLPPVEEIVGNDWYDESYYTKSEDIVDIRYFSKVVFVGDSRTEGLLLYAGLPNMNGYCYKGLTVDKLTSSSSIYVEGYGNNYTCYDAISLVPYDTYYCSFGINELGWVNIDLFIEYFNELIDHIRSVSPDAVIYVQNILPVSKKESSSDSIFTQERINLFNEELLTMCQERKDVIYLDVASAVMNEEGYLPSEASGDGIHCNASYCKRIIQYIRCNTYTKK